MVDSKPVSVPALRRLPRYLQYLRALQQKGQKAISASQMSIDLDVQHTLVRKDLAMTGMEGVPKVGHKIDDLISGIECFLNWNNVTDAFLVGFGNLGSALVGDGGFKKTGINIVAAFDVDPNKVGRRIQGIEVLPMAKLSDLVRRMNVHIGIITTSHTVAQEVADDMVKSGILAIWNFAPVSLKVPESVIVEEADIYASLAVLSRKLNQRVKRI